MRISKDELKRFVSSVKKLVVETVREFAKDDCHRMAAALAYYTTFSLPALLVVVIMVAGSVLGAETAEKELRQRIGRMLGEEAAGQIGAMIHSATDWRAGGTGAAIIGLGALLFGATRAFAQLQVAMNRMWGVRPRRSIKNLLRKRFISFLLVVGIGLLLMISLVLNAVLTAFTRTAEGYLPGYAGGVLMSVVEQTLSFVVFLLFFGGLFKVLPDANVRWHDVALGAFVTAVLFILGESALGVYLAHSPLASAYGAAGALAIVLVWIYYSSMILFLGAEFTHVWTRDFGRVVQPARGAVKIQGDRGIVQEPSKTGAPAATKQAGNVSSSGNPQRSGDEEKNEAR
jgi:membrane protein